MFPSLFWWGDHGSCNHLVLSQDFAIARAWYSVLRDTTKPAYHSKNPWQQVVLSWPNASLSSTAWCCNFLSSIDQENLPWSIFHVALPLFFLWANRNTHLSHWPTPYCINWFTPANVSMTYAYDAYGPVSWMRMHGIFVSQGMIWWWILPLSLYASTRRSSRQVIYILAMAIVLCLPPLEQCLC